MALSFISRLWLSKEQKEKKIISAEIDKALVKHKQYLRREIKILLLGSGESGKSTFMKQMRMIYDSGTGFPERERRDSVKVILRNLCAGIQTLIKAMEKLKIPYADASNSERGLQFLYINFTWSNAVVPTSEHIEVCKILWSDSGIRECFSRRHEYYITESAKYYLPMTDVVTAPDYIPTDKDYLHATDCNSGFKEFCFKLQDTSIRIVDAGAGLLRRSKWSFRVFDNITTVLFLAALSDYDRHEYEEETRLHGSIAHFKMIITNFLFRNRTFILLLNKKDLLEEKIQYSHLADHFPEYDGPRQDAVAACNFISDKFHSNFPDPERVLYTHCICATDAESVKFSFEALWYAVLRMSLDDYTLA